MNFYKICLEANGYVNFEFSNENLTSTCKGWIITLYDKDSNDLTELISYQNKIKTKSCNIGLPKGEYYIKVENYYDLINTDCALKVNYKKPQIQKIQKVNF